MNRPKLSIVDKALDGLKLPSYAQQAGFICLSCGFQPLKYSNLDKNCPIDNSKARGSIVIGLVLMAIIQSNQVMMGLTDFSAIKNEEIYNRLKGNVYNAFKEWLYDFNKRVSAKESECIMPISKWDHDGILEYDGINLIEHYIYQLSRLQTNPSAIKEIKVSNLFNKKNYSLTFTNKHEDIQQLSLVLGENGLGKTTLLNILQILLYHENELVDDFLIEKTVRFFCDTPFSEIQICFNGGAIFTITQTQEALNSIISSISYVPMDLHSGFTQDNANVENVEFKAINREYDAATIKENIENHYKNLRLLGLDFSNDSFCLIKDDRIPSPELLERCMRIIYNERGMAISKHLETSLSNLIIPAFMNDFDTIADEIGKNRNQIISKAFSYTTSNAFMSLELDIATKEMLEDIRSFVSNSSVFSQRILKKNDTELLHSCEALLSVARTNNEHASVPEALRSAVETLWSYLAAFADFQWGMGELYAIGDKNRLIPILCQITPSAKKYCMVFQRASGEPIPINRLSSGEINLATILYYICFHVRHDGLILIDEPEISLHIIWQETLTKIIKELISKRETQVIMMTHSPFITNEFLDLIVEAKKNE